MAIGKLQLPAQAVRVLISRDMSHNKENRCRCPAWVVSSDRTVTAQQVDSRPAYASSARCVRMHPQMHILTFGKRCMRMEQPCL